MWVGALWVGRWADVTLATCTGSQQGVELKERLRRDRASGRNASAAGVGQIWEVVLRVGALSIGTVVRWEPG